MNLKIKKNLTKSELVCRYRQLILDFGCGFHPDTLAEDYTPGLTKKEKVDLNNSLEILHTELEDKVYEIGCLVLEFESAELEELLL